jgi:hypothetical protein
MKIYLAGPPSDTDVREQLLENGHTLYSPERPALGRVDVGDLLRWICRNADAVYMLPGWRSCLVARAARATMLAAGGKVLGFE